LTLYRPQASTVGRAAYAVVGEGDEALVEGNVADPRLQERRRSAHRGHVDLLTTGIDVPSITNLVFLRRVNSRILYGTR
jgi:type I restriction enzyme R subunit